MKKVILCLLIFLFSIGTVSAFSLSGGGDWKYYKEITIKENSGKTLTNYQILVELNSANFDFSKAKSDGSDIRFSTDSQELSYWIEEWDSNAKKAKIWVKVPLIPANGETKIKMWYGNPSAVSSSNGNKVFEFFDDFEDNDISDWTIIYGSVTCYNGVMIVNPTSKHCKSPDHPSGDPYLFQCAALYKNYTYTGPLVAEFDFKLSKIWQGVNNGVTRVRFLYQDWFNYWEVLLGGDAEDNDYRLNKRVSGEKPTYPFGDPTVIGDTNWHTAKIVRDQNGNWELYRDGVKILGGNDPWLPTISAFYIWFPNAPTTYFDNIRIRKYTSPEPTVTIQEYPTPKPTTPPPKPPAGKIKAIWLYNYDRYDLPTLVNDLKSAGINTIFLSTDVNNIWKYERFVKTAHENGIEVHAMILEIADNKEEGTYDYTNFYKNPYHKDEAVKDVEKILDYNEKSLAAFDGINIDIEPYTSDLWNSNREDVWNDYMEVINAIKEKINGRTKLSANILYDSRDYTEDRIKDLASVLDFFVIMAYDSGGLGFNTPEKIKDAVAQEMGSIRGERAKAVIGIGVHEGFGDKSDVENCINDLFDYYSDDPAFLGISIFRYYSYSELPETKKTPEENRQTGEEKEIPGFECIFAITLLAVAYMLKRLKK